MPDLEFTAPEQPLLVTSRRPSVVEIPKQVVEAVRDPRALALYVYIRSGLNCQRMRQLESAVDHFGWSIEEADSAYAELSRRGLLL